jgi:SAM-dependent methyltransferase
MSTDEAWQQWGLRDPYFAVLTNPKFRSEALTPEARLEFFASGRHTVSYVLNTCRQYLDDDFSPKRILDFGCGVGRLSIPFAEFANEVVGLDVSDAMLAQARLNSKEHNCANVTFAMSDDILSNAEGRFDLVHSCLVLQHLQVARGRRIFSELVDKVATGGCGAIQITYGWDRYPEHFGEVPVDTSPPPRDSFVTTAKNRIRQLFGSPRPTEPIQPVEPPDPEMQMNYYSLSQLMFILENAGIKRVLSELTNHGGALGTFMFFRKDSA